MLLGYDVTNSQPLGSRTVEARSPGIDRSRFVSVGVSNMSTEAAGTWLAGRRDLLVEGVIACLAQTDFPVMRCFASFSDVTEHQPLPLGTHLCIQIVGKQSGDLEETCRSVAHLRRSAASATIICIADDTGFDASPLMAAGANGCLQGRLTSAELKLLLTLIVAGDVSLCVGAPMRAGESEPLPCSRPMRNRAAEIQSERSLAQAGLGPPDVALSRREREVLAGLADGHSNKTLARGLSISEATVKAHVRTVFRKLGAHSRTQAVRCFLDQHASGATGPDWLISTSLKPSGRSADHSTSP